MAHPSKRSRGKFEKRTARVEGIELFEVKKEELDSIESGIKDVPTELGFTTFLLSLTLNGIATVFFTATSDTEKIFWGLIAVFGAIFTAYFYLAWRRGRKNRIAVISEIRNRMQNGGETLYESDQEDQQIPSRIRPTDDDDDLPF